MKVLNNGGVGYELPRITVSRIEIEGALCGSAPIANPNNAETGQIEAQTINKAFDNGGWTSSDYNNTNWEAVGNSTSTEN